MAVPLLSTTTQEEAGVMAALLCPVVLADVLNSVEVTQELSKPDKSGQRQRLYHVMFKLLPNEDYQQVSAICVQ